MSDCCVHWTGGAAMNSAHFVGMDEAALLVSDGMVLALGGVTLYRRPVAFVQALLSRTPRPHDLTLLAFTAGYASDLLVGAGCVRRVRSCYFGLEAYGFAPMFTQKAQQGELEITEETEASLVLGIRAALSNVSFLPSRAWQGTDMQRLRPDVVSMIDPYDGQSVTAFPAITCDVAVLHGLAADSAGNVLLNNNLGVDPELSLLADTVIVTVERRVDQLVPSADGYILPSAVVEAIVVAPRGAWPTGCHPVYPVGGGQLLAYVDACASGDFDGYLRRFTDQST